MKKNILKIVLSLLLVFSLVACQKTTDKTETNEPSESEKVEESKDVTETEDSKNSEETEKTEKSTETEETTEEKEEAKSAPVLATSAKLVAMKGPTAMGLAKYTSETINEEANSNLSYSIETMPDQVAAGLVKGEIQIACIPANLAATVYNKSEGKIQVAATNVLNVLNFATNNAELNSLEELKGKTIYSTGKGATPEVILNNLLEKAGLVIGTDVTIEFLPEATEVAAKLQAEDGAIAFLPEPFLSSVLMKNEQIQVKLNINELWTQYFGEDAGVVTGVLVVNKEFVDQNHEWFDNFLEDYKASAEWVNANPADAALIIGEQEIIGAPVAEKAIPNTGITVLTGADLKTKLSSYLEVLATNNPELVGGTLPADDFYY